MKTIIVGGTFNDTCGKPSGYVFKLAEALGELCDITVVNGGSLQRLENLSLLLGSYDVAIWMADVANDQPKLADEGVESLKRRFPKLILVTSKRNLESDDYTVEELLQRALKTKSNLLLALGGTRTQVLTTILDPLGSAYAVDEGDIGVVAKTLQKRLERLLEFTRVPTVQFGPKIEAPDEAEFFTIIREQAERFHDIIHGVKHTRLMGNASFRCAKGFPSMRTSPGRIFVSQRDIDKRYVDRTAFVAVDLGTKTSAPIHYYGDAKPSVDTPIQVALYRHFKNVNYMLHSHTYIKGVPMTSEPVPCGALEEAHLLRELYSLPTATNFAVNLRGHGSIVLASDLEFLKNQPWQPRQVPELYVEL